MKIRFLLAVLSLFVAGLMPGVGFGFRVSGFDFNPAPCTDCYAPVGATYITQTGDATLSAEQALASLSTGLLKVTTGTGVLSSAAVGTDYADGSGTQNVLAAWTAATGVLGDSSPAITCDGTKCILATTSAFPGFEIAGTTGDAASIKLFTASGNSPALSLYSGAVYLQSYYNATESPTSVYHQIVGDAAANIVFRNFTAGTRLTLTAAGETQFFDGLWADASNYEGLQIDGVSGTQTISAITAGTGADDIDVVMLPAGKGSVALASGTEGGTGQISWFWAHETHTLAAAASSTTTLSPAIASGDIVHGCLATVNTAVVDSAGDDTWSAAWDASLASTAMESGVAPAQNTKSNFLFAPLKATGVAQVVFTPNGGNFSAGVIEIMCLVQSAANMADV